MDKDELYPDLAEYIFQYCGGFFWSKQKFEIQVPSALVNSPYANVGMYKVLTQGGKISNDPVVGNLANDGYEAYKFKITRLIYEQYKHELPLNLCPKCGKIARTPYAQQCRYCFYDWHEYKSV